MPSRSETARYAYIRRLSGNPIPNAFGPSFDSKVALDVQAKQIAKGGQPETMRSQATSARNRMVRDLSKGQYRES